MESTISTPTGCYTGSLVAIGTYGIDYCTDQRPEACQHPCHGRRTRKRESEDCRHGFCKVPFLYPGTSTTWCLLLQALQFSVEASGRPRSCGSNFLVQSSRAPLGGASLHKGPVKPNLAISLENSSRRSISGLLVVFSLSSWPVNQSFIAGDLYEFLSFPSSSA